MARIYRAVGRRACIPVVYVVAAYFFVTKGQARRDSRAYLEALYATPEGRKAVKNMDIISGRKMFFPALFSGIDDI